MSKYYFLEEIIMIETINVAKKLNTYALIRASWLSDNFISSFEPLIITLINKKLYEQIKVEDLCKDFESEYGIALSAFPCIKILGEIQKKGFIKYIKESKNWRPVFDVCSSIDITNKSSDIHDSFGKLKRDFMIFTKDRYNIELSDTDAVLWIENYVRMNSAEIFKGQVKEKKDEVDSIKITADYILFLINEKNDNIDVFKKIAIGKLIVDALEFNDVGKDLSNVTFYLDTRVVLYFIGFYGEFRQKTYENLLLKLSEKGAKLRMFSHTKQEIMNILVACEKWIDSANYNPELSSSAMRYLRSKGLDSGYVRDKIVSLERKYSEFDIIEDNKSYKDYDEKYQIDSMKLEEHIINCYSKNGVDLNDSVLETIGYDVKSIELVYYIREEENVRNYNQTKAILLTTNRNLVYASKVFSSEFYGDAIPSCISDVTLGTIVWVQSGIKYCDELIESKLISDCSASMEVSQQAINKFCSFVDKMGSQQLLTDMEIAALKSYGLTTEAAKPKLYSAQDFEEKDIHEIMDEIRESTISEEKEKHTKEVESLNQNIDELTEENENLRQQSSELEKIKQIEGEKIQNIRNDIGEYRKKFDKILKIFQLYVNLAFNIVVQIILFIPIIQGIWELILRISVPVLSFILALIIQFDKFRLKQLLQEKYIKNKIYKSKKKEINVLYDELKD